MQQRPRIIQTTLTGRSVRSFLESASDFKYYKQDAPPGLFELLLPFLVRSVGAELFVDNTIMSRSTSRVRGDLFLLQPAGTDTITYLVLSRTGCALIPERLSNKSPSHFIGTTPLLFSPSRQKDSGQAKGGENVVWDGSTTSFWSTSVSFVLRRLMPSLCISGMPGCSTPPELWGWIQLVGFYKRSTPNGVVLGTFVSPSSHALLLDESRRVPTGLRTRRVVDESSTRGRRE